MGSRPNSSIFSEGRVAKGLPSPYLSVEEAVEKRREEALERDEEGGEETPDGEVDEALVVRGGHHLEAVGNAQQGLQDDRGLHGLTEIMKHASYVCT